MAKLSADGMIKSKERTSMHDIKDALLIGLEGVGKTTVKAFVVTPFVVTPSWNAWNFGH